jgi:hypothetical protein
MLLFFEIALTIAAWKKGWSARAFLPLAGAFLVALLAGAVVGASGGSIACARILAFLCDLGAVIALGIMSKKSPAISGTSLALTRSDESVRLTDATTASGD